MHVHTMSISERLKEKLHLLVSPTTFNARILPDDLNQAIGLIYKYNEKGVHYV